MTYNEHVEYCRTYWGSHGCMFERGHSGPCICDCCEAPAEHMREGSHVLDGGAVCVGAPPYYGPQTNFYGQDAP